ncbi:MAG: ATP-binding protein [Leptospiraceae bacterium]|nr:ATP-binding protein [Leptospiraceae bacterium]
MLGFELEERILECLKSFLPFGLTGYVDDFTAWVKMEFVKQNLDKSLATSDKVRTLLENLKREGEYVAGKFDPNEYTPAEKYLLSKKNWYEDNYTILGAFEYSPIQYVRSRLEFFLHSNQVTEMDIMDISIATIEGIENAVKYGDGENVFLSCSITADRTLKISILNTIKQFDLESEIKRGKYSSTTTLMRGIMVMQKLFNHIDLQIIEDKQQALLYAEKVLN